MDGIERLRDRISAAPEVLFAFLFGSRAEGRERRESDWDVGIYLRDDLSASQRFQTRVELLATLAPRQQVDLVILNEVPAPLAHQALLGQRLFVRDRAAYVRFFVRTLAAAPDERFWTSVHVRERRRRIEEGRFGRP